MTKRKVVEAVLTSSRVTTFMQLGERQSIGLAWNVVRRVDIFSACNERASVAEAERRRRRRRRCRRQRGVMETGVGR